MKNLGIALFGATVILAYGVGYFGSPYYAAWNLMTSARNADRDALAHEIDFPAVRESLKNQFSATMLSAMQRDPGIKNNPFAGLGAALVPTVVNHLVDSYVTPDALANLIASGRAANASQPNVPDAGPSNTQTKLSFDGLNLFRMTISAAGNDDTMAVGLVFERRGLFSWKMVSIDLPQLEPPSDPSVAQPQKAPTQIPRPSAPPVALTSTPPPQTTDNSSVAATDSDSASTNPVDAPEPSTPDTYDVSGSPPASDDNAPRQLQPDLQATLEPPESQKNQPPAQQTFETSFDCSRVASTIEYMLCTNKDLAAMDVQTATLYAKILAKATDQNQMQEEQRNWLMHRNGCSNVGCLRIIYTGRINRLSAQDRSLGP